MRDPDQRLIAARALLSNPTPDALPILEAALTREEEPRVLAMLELASAALKTQTGPIEARLEAVAALSGSMNPDVWQILGQLVGKGGDGADEIDTAVANAATSLETIETKKQFCPAETIFFGVSLGPSYWRRLGWPYLWSDGCNQHGPWRNADDRGLYTVVQQLMPGGIEYSLFVAIPVAFVVTGLIGILIERSVIRVLYGRPLETLLATFGISLSCSNWCEPSSPLSTSRSSHQTG